jgi:RNA polymerase sigma-70 factor (ECF subfamily)
MMEHEVIKEEKTDEELVRLTLSDQRFFAEIVNKYEKPLSRYVRRLMPSLGEEKKDMLQEIFIKTYLHLNSFNGELKFSSWVYRIAHNHIVSELRKRDARPKTVSLENSEYGAFAHKALDESTTEHDARYAKEEVEYVLGKMDDEYRTVLILRFLEEKDYSEISDILKKSVGTVGTMISRAKAQFKKEYEKRYGK